MNSTNDNRYSSGGADRYAEEEGVTHHDDKDVERTETVPSKHGPDRELAREDVDSDPALDDRLGSDWIDEGGATSVGPATSTPGGVETEESKRQVRIDRERSEKRERKDADERGDYLP